MSGPPFGLGGGEGDDPLGLSALFGGALGPNPLAGLQRLLLSPGSGPVNWELARQVATAAAGQDDPPVTPAEQAQVVEACRLADVWLDGHSSLPAAGADGAAWTRTQWVELTLPAWQRLVTPVAGRVVEAMGRALEQGLAGLLGGEAGGAAGALPPELLAGLGGGGIGSVMQQVGGLVFGAQVGQALGGLATEVVGAAEVCLPLSPAPGAALLPANVERFSAGLELPVEEARLYLALRESAAQRLFAHVPWLAAHLFDTVAAYAQGIEVDGAAIERAVGSLDPSDPESIQRAMSQGVFELDATPAQQAALLRLETALALVDGWVDVVCDRSARPALPSAAALQETVRRRRASGGPAEQTFATLVGLQLRPRRLREAAALWSRLTDEQGPAGRDALWAHPDLLPGPGDLDDPAAFLGQAPQGETDWDAELRGLDDGGAPPPAAPAP